VILVSTMYFGSNVIYYRPMQLCVKFETSQDSAECTLVEPNV
jgi:hypothetical protein